MRGRKPVRPLTEVADAAVRVFTDKGFRRAGISDVSAELGLSHGALYTYVDSKQALLYLALLRTVRPDAVGSLTLPVDARRAEAELGALIDTLYGFIERNYLALNLIEKCATDLPELTQWFFLRRRRAALERIGDFLRERIEAGELRPV